VTDLDEYQKKRQENVSAQLELWRNLAQDIFAENTQKVQVVTDTNEIIKILGKIAKSKALNHTFIPSGGGNDLIGAAPSSEQQCIELIFSSRSADIIKPVSLTFNPIGENPEWWYYRINTKAFEPSGVYEQIEKNQDDSSSEAFKFTQDKEIERLGNYGGEEVVEISPNNYIERFHWDNGFYGHDENGYEKRLPDNARIITRMYKGGDFVIFSKFSAYNKVSGTYDGRHNKYNDEDFRIGIKQVVDKLQK